MTRNSKTLVTGGLLGLAGLGLLPKAAEAQTPNTPLEVDPAAGAAVAENPHSVAVPEPAAQTSAPQVDPDDTPQPAWSPALDQTAPPPEPVALAPKPDPEAKAKVPPLAASLSLAATVEESPEAAPQATTPTTVTASMTDRPDSSSIPEVASKLAPESASEAAPAPGAKAPSDQLAPSETAANPTVDSAAPAIARLTHPEPPIPSVAVPMPAAPTAADAMPQVRISTPARSQPASSPDATPAIADRPIAAADPSPTAEQPQDISVEAIAARIQRSQAIARAPIPQVPTRRVSRQEPQLPVLPTAGTPPTSTTPAQATEPPLSPRVTAVAPAAPNPKPALSPRRVELPAFVTHTSQPQADRATPGGPRGPRSQPSTAAADLIAQAPTDLAQAPEDEATAEQIRQDLRVDPLTVPGTPPRTYPPSPNAGIPSAFGAEWGDVFASATLAGADRVRTEADGSLSVGLGLGDARSLVGVELAYNILSIRRFAENGNFDVKVHRQLYRDDQTQVAAALGWNNFARYGSNAVNTESSPYGMVSAAHLLQPEHPTNRLPITGTLGVGGGDFSTDNSDVGVIAGVGLQVHPQMSVNAAWSGVGLNVGTSLVISPTVPLTLTMTYGDITNNTAAGSVAVVTLGYGFRASPRF